MAYLPSVEIEPKIPANTSVIWLHGLGADGHDFVPIAKELTLPATAAVRFIFPHAPRIPVTINQGYVMPAWYDILEMTIDRKVDAKQLRASADQVVALIEREIARGIASQRIFLAGFSQGGAVVYEAALSYAQPLGGLLILSSYLATVDSIQLNPANKGLPILIQHGTSDPIVPEALGQKAYRFLMDKGYNVDYQNYPMEHTLCLEQIKDISDWFKQRLAQ
jgi:phospholipase/carboxylesterase